MQKRFVVRKFVMAGCAKDAIERESSLPVDEVFLAEEQPHKGSTADAIGFRTYPEPNWRADEIIARRRR